MSHTPSSKRDQVAEVVAAVYDLSTDEARQVLDGAERVKQKKARYLHGFSVGGNRLTVEALQADRL